MVLLANSFMVDHGTPSATSGFFHPQNLPNIQKHRTNNNNSNNRIENIKARLSYSSSPLLHIQNVEHIRPTPIDIQCEENNNNNGTRTRRASSSLRIQHVGPMRPTPPQLVHRTTPVDVRYEEDASEITTTTTTTTTISLSAAETPTRRQLHVYMPQILSC
jgi:hypothetical protein